MMRLWLRLHGLKWNGASGCWVQGGKEVIPEYVVVTWLLIEAIAILGLLLGFLVVALSGAFA